MGLRCWLAGHDPVMERYERGADGGVRRAYRHELRWRCQTCGREVGATLLKPNTRLLRQMRVQAGAVRQRLKLVRKVS